MPYTLLYYLVCLLFFPTFLFALWAQINVSTTYSKASKHFVSLSGAEAARMILDRNSLGRVPIDCRGPHLSDHYDPTNDSITLSADVHNGRSAAAVGVAAHEAGHAIQYGRGYSLIKLRSAIIPVSRFGSMAAMPLFLIGMLLPYFGYAAGELGYYLMLIGILFFSLAVLFQVVTLPVEFDASRRALEALRASGTMTEEDIAVSAKVLRAAALTYVAALATSLLQLLRLIVIAAGNNRRR